MALRACWERDINLWGGTEWHQFLKLLKKSNALLRPIPHQVQGTSPVPLKRQPHTHHAAGKEEWLASSERTRFVQYCMTNE